MQFKEVIGQQTTKSKLVSMATSGKMPHAIMLLGPEGNGSLALALALAQFVQCENKSEDDSCGLCSSCIKNQKLIHPDVHFTFPVVPKVSGEKPISTDYIHEWRKAIANNPYLNVNDWLQEIEAENKQGNITVRECHEIIRAMHMKTYESTYKIQIIWLAEFLKETGNILLKLIEEPPANTLFFIVVENVQLILTTIISRTQLIKINAIEDIDIQQALVVRFEIDETAADRIARISDGNFNAALSYAEGAENANDKLLHRWFVACFKLKEKNNPTNTANLFEWIDEVSKIGRENQKIFLKYALFFLRECFLINTIERSAKLAGEELDFATKLSVKLDVDQLQTLSILLTRLHYHIERNGNPKILFTSNSFKIARIFANEAVEIES